MIMFMIFYIPAVDNKINDANNPKKRDVFILLFNWNYEKSLTVKKSDSISRQ